jgi:hypothetical protein
MNRQQTAMLDSTNFNSKNAKCTYDATPETIQSAKATVSQERFSPSSCEPLVLKAKTPECLHKVFFDIMST